MIAQTLSENDGLGHAGVFADPHECFTPPQVRVLGPEACFRTFRALALVDFLAVLEGLHEDFHSVLFGDALNDVFLELQDHVSKRKVPLDSRPHLLQPFRAEPIFALHEVFPSLGV